MAIHEQQVTQMGSGHIKTIEESAMGLILDNLQKYQYQFPIKSTTRELLSNAVDSISDKIVAQKILSGQARVEDFFVEREGDLYKDSRFDPSYYDLNWLDTDNKIEMRYITGTGSNKDLVTISDSGIGMSAKRLEGYLKMGYSTKRLSKLPLGKWGIGAKSPLSVGVDFYTVESRYNGMLFRFNIYSRTVDSIIPKLNSATGGINDFVLFNENTEHEYKVYYEKTVLKNGVTVTIGDVKKHHKQQYIDAVKSQMLYFDGIDFIVVNENGHEDHINYKATILYEDEFIVLSDNSYWSKPHLLLNKVNYGYVNWEELELEDRTGNIGIKVAPEDIEVSPSRENVLWSDKTKQMIHERFHNVQDIATTFIQKELEEPDFLKWLRTCYNISGRYTEGNSIVNRLSKIVDLTQITPKYTIDPTISFSQTTILEGIYSRLVMMDTIREKNKTHKKVVRKELKHLGQYINLPIVLIQEGSVENRKDKYLLSLYPHGFVQIKAPLTVEKSAVEYSPEFAEWLETLRAKKPIDVNKLWEYLSNSNDVLFYDKIEVPEDFKSTNSEEVEDKSEEQEKEEEISSIVEAERRKLEGKIIIQTPIAVPSYTKGNLKAFYETAQLEEKISDINNYSAEEIYYGNSSDDELLHLAAALTRDPCKDNELGKYPIRTHASNYSKWQELKWYRLNKDRLNNYGVLHYKAYYYQHFFDTSIMLIKCARSNNKYFRDFRHIQQFFIHIERNTITMSNTLIKWNTARIIVEHLGKLKFLTNFESFNSIYAQGYQELIKYIDANFRHVTTDLGNYGLNPSSYSDLIAHLNSVQTFQEFVHDNLDDKESIAALAQGLFGNAQLRNGHAVDPEILYKLNRLIEFSTACGPLLNEITLLTVPNQKISEDIEQEIKSYLEIKGILNYDVPLTKIPAIPLENDIEMGEDQDNLVPMSSEAGGTA